eukprot:6482922-Amphidinium_carterae.1
MHTHTHTQRRAQASQTYDAHDSLRGLQRPQTQGACQTILNDSFGSCMQETSDLGPQQVPYRDSALTWLLKDAITGSSARVCMVAAVHPDHPQETVSELLGSPA